MRYGRAGLGRVLEVGAGLWGVTWWLLVWVAIFATLTLAILGILFAQVDFLLHVGMERVARAPCCLEMVFNARSSMDRGGNDRKILMLYYVCKHVMPSLI